MLAMICDSKERSELSKEAEIFPPQLSGQFRESARVMPLLPGKRTINITEYRNAKDDVNPAKNRTFGGILHFDSFTPLSNALIIQSLSIENLLHTFFNPRLPSFGLFGCRKIKNVCSLPSRRQWIKSSFQGRDFF